MQAKIAIADYIDSQADWRGKKADEYPEDERNNRAAVGLTELAAYIRSLSDDDECLRELASVGMVPNGSEFGPGTETSRAISLFRFDRADEDCGEFLNSLVRLATEDALELGKLAGEIDD